MFELAGVGIVQRVLKLGLVQPGADRNVLRGLHIKRDALDLGEVGPQPSSTGGISFWLRSG